MLVKKAKDDLLPCDIVFDKFLDPISGTALDICHYRRVVVDGTCRLRTGRDTHGKKWAKVSCVEAAGEEIVQLFQHLLAYAGKVYRKAKSSAKPFPTPTGLGEGLALLFNFWCADTDLVELFSTQQVLIVQPATGGGLPGKPTLLRGAVPANTAFPLTLMNRWTRLAKRRPRCTAVWARMARRLDLKNVFFTTGGRGGRGRKSKK